jgi:hypothetical protein
VHDAGLKKSTAREGCSLVDPGIIPELSQTVDASDLFALPVVD